MKVRKIDAESVEETKYQELISAIYDTGLYPKQSLINKETGTAMSTISDRLETLERDYVVSVELSVLPKCSKHENGCEDSGDVRINGVWYCHYHAKEVRTQ